MSHFLGFVASEASTYNSEVLRTWLASLALIEKNVSFLKIFTHDKSINFGRIWQVGWASRGSLYDRRVIIIITPSLHLVEEELYRM